jgi:hypothetical protein
MLSFVWPVAEPGQGHGKGGGLVRVGLSGGTGDWLAARGCWPTLLAPGASRASLALGSLATEAVAGAVLCVACAQRGRAVRARCGGAHVALLSTLPKSPTYICIYIHASYIYILSRFVWGDLGGCFFLMVLSV